MINCPNCHTLNRDRANFCRHCARVLVALCPRCGTDLPNQARFCDNCAFPLIPTVGALDLSVAFMGSELPGRQRPSAPAEFTAAWDLQVSQETPAKQTTAAEEGSPGDSAFAGALSRFLPRELAEKLQAAGQGSVSGERRVVTILFCDVIGSTAAAETLDPEEWTEIINGAFEHMIRPVFRYEGTVARLMGDGILAFFGAPIAHEDDPYRAVRAGLDIIAGIARFREDVLRRWGIDFNVRVGINTGLVVVGAVGSDLRMEYTAIGDAINVASRMEQTAMPGTVQVAEETYRLVEDAFEFESLGTIEVKGKQAPVQAYQVQRRRGMTPRRRAREGVSGPFIGRESELAALKSVVDSLRLGIGRVVLLTGDAGVGKSRLLLEVRRYAEQYATVDGEPPLFWLETRSLSFETAQPYTVFRRLIRWVYQLSEDAPAEVVEQKVAALADTFPNEERPGIYALFAALLELDSLAGHPALNGEQFKQALFDSTPAMFRGQLGGQRTVIVCEDLHWGDPASVALIEHWFEQTEVLPLVLVCVMRPVRTAPAWRIRTTLEQRYRHRSIELPLQPLSIEESGRLVDGLLEDPNLPQQWRRHILENAGGNPYFIEEVVLALKEQRQTPSTNGAAAESRGLPASSAEMPIPASLRALLTARIDNLPEDTRRVLQLAAVIGRTFNRRILAAICGDEQNIDAHLQTLLRRDLIQETSRLPEVVYAFRSPFVQEAAYDAILRKERRSYHCLVAEALESQRPAQQAGLQLQLARHYREGGMNDLAAYYFIAAGDAALKLHAREEAIIHYEAALAAAQEAGEVFMEERLIHLYTQLGRALELDAQFSAALARYQEMERLANRRYSRPMMLSALVLQGQLYAAPNQEYDIERGIAVSLRALQIAEELDDQPAQAKINWSLLNLHRFTADMETAAAYGERALEISRRLDLKKQLAFTLNDLAHIRSSEGAIQRALDYSMEAAKLWREMDDLPMLSDSLATAASVYAHIGEFDNAIAASDEALEISNRINNVWGLSYSRFTVGIVYWLRGRPDLALNTMEECIHYARIASFSVALITVQTDLAIALAELGNFERARSMVADALSHAGERMAAITTYAQAGLIRIHVLAGDLAAAELSYADLGDLRPEILELLPTYPEIPHCIMYLRQGRFEEAAAMALEAIDTLSRFQLNTLVPEAYLLRGLALSGLGDANGARICLQQGRDLCEKLNAPWYLWQILAAQAAIEPEPDVARRLNLSAWAIAEEIAGYIDQPALREGFLAREDVRRLRTLARGD